MRLTGWISPNDAVDLLFLSGDAALLEAGDNLVVLSRLDGRERVSTDQLAAYTSSKYLLDSNYLFSFAESDDSEDELLPEPLPLPELLDEDSLDCLFLFLQNAVLRSLIDNEDIPWNGAETNFTYLAICSRLRRRSCFLSVSRSDPLLELLLLAR